MFDKLSIEKYNMVFRFLMRIKRANYIIHHRDFWARTRPRRDLKDLNVQEQILEKNKVEFNNLQHKLQIFQRELQQFTNNIEYYFKTGALKHCCNVISARINGMGDQESSLDPLNPEKVFKVDDVGVDMDKLVQVHKEFLDSAVRRCMPH